MTKEEEQLLKKIAEIEKENHFSPRTLPAAKSGAALLDPTCPEDVEWFYHDEAYRF